MKNVRQAINGIVLFAVLLAAGLVFRFVIIPNQIVITKIAASEPFSPDTFPNFIITVFNICAACGILISVVRLIKAKGKQEQTAPETAVEQKAPISKGRKIFSELIPLIIFGLCYLYSFLFKNLGVIPATLISLLLILAALGCRKPKYYIIVLIFAVLFYLLFRFILKVPLR